MENKDKEDVVPGSPAPLGPDNENKHRDDAAEVPSDKLEKKAKEEFEEHSMTDQRGYNELDPDLPVKKKNVSAQRATKETEE